MRKMSHTVYLIDKIKYFIKKYTQSLKIVKFRNSIS